MRKNLTTGLLMGAALAVAAMPASAEYYDSETMYDPSDTCKILAAQHIAAFKTRLVDKDSREEILGRAIYTENTKDLVLDMLNTVIDQTDAGDHDNNMSRTVLNFHLDCIDRVSAGN